MRGRTRPEERTALARRETLEAFVRRYHHLQNEHKRAKTDSGIRRRIEDQLLEVREEFDRFLVEWIPDEELQAAWREYLEERRSEPDGPPPVIPLVFEGSSDNGSLIRIRGNPREELTVEIDGSLVERIVGEKDFASTDPSPLRFRHDSTDFTEIFGASPDALRALIDFTDTDDESPPWKYAPELLADGLIDTHFALSPRGRRAVARLG
jgi:hypothetical protein